MASADRTARFPDVEYTGSSTGFSSTDGARGGPAAQRSDAKLTGRTRFAAPIWTFETPTPLSVLSSVSAGPRHRAKRQIPGRGPE